MNAVMTQNRWARLTARLRARTSVFNSNTPMRPTLRQTLNHLDCHHFGGLASGSFCTLPPHCLSALARVGGSLELVALDPDGLYGTHPRHLFHIVAVARKRLAGVAGYTGLDHQRRRHPLMMDAWSS